MCDAYKAFQVRGKSNKGHTHSRKFKYKGQAQVQNSQDVDNQLFQKQISKVSMLNFE